MSGSVEIPVGKDHVALVDPRDSYLAVLHWNPFRNGAITYACRSPRKGDSSPAYMHQWIVGKEWRVKFKNGNGLDCRRANLITYPSLQHHQRAAAAYQAPRGASRFLGVDFARSCGRWRARINVAGANKHLGYFDTQTAANSARLNAEYELWGVLPARRQAFLDAGWDV